MKYTTTIELLEALGIDPTTLGPQMSQAIDALAQITCQLHSKLINAHWLKPAKYISPAAAKSDRIAF